VSPREAALAHLALRLDEARDPNEDERPWKQAYLRGSLLAYERTGVLTAVEAARWRERVAEPPTKVSADPGLRAAAEGYLETVATDGERLAALSAFAQVGLLDEDRLSGRGWTAYGPIDEDGAWEAPVEVVDDAREVRRAVLGSPERQEGLAVVGLVVHENAVSLHFHWLGEPAGDERECESLDAFDRALDHLVAPDLHDDAGTRYEPVEDRPMSAHGMGGLPDSEHLEVVSGRWQYRPAAPDAARTFTATSGERSWVLGG
jgi:hypothetical protein